MKLTQPYHIFPSSMTQVFTLKKSEKPSVFLYVNMDLVRKLRLEALLTQEGCEFLSGYESSWEMTPISLAYSGHQFGYFTNLGDGRATILGRYKGFDFGLKGSGPTRFSRGGDGLVPFPAAIKETLYAHALSSLNVPSSRVLSVTFTHKYAHRDQVWPAAVLCRLMRSSMRIGTIQFVSKYLTLNEVTQSLDVAIETLLPSLSTVSNKYELFTLQCMSNWAKLVSQWQSVGFVHGVLNTDNVSLAYETIDFGPCAFLEKVQLNKAFSSIDVYNRYAFANQEKMIRFNASIFLDAMMGLLKGNEVSVEAYHARYLSVFDSTYLMTMESLSGKKLGLIKSDLVLWNDLLMLCETLSLDFTQTFAHLTLNPSVLYGIDERLDKWLNTHQEQVDKEGLNPFERKAMMLSVNPMIILRHDLVNTIIEMCLDHDYSLMDEVMEILKTPYDSKHYNHPLFKPSLTDIVTTCGT
jgi:uncharacterized protein YdiU (UPF0061 family)